jgi:hypothetical protein
MHGNALEWCFDWYGDYPDYGDYSDGSASDPVGPSVGTKRVSRGGCWLGFGGSLRSAERLGHWPVFRFIRLGFRLSLQTAKTERPERNGVAVPLLLHPHPTKVGRTKSYRRGSSSGWVM